VSSGSSLDKLFAAKVRALLHDPPYKSVCLSKSIAGDKCDHEEEAKIFRRELVVGTALEGLGTEAYEEVAKRADVVAAGLDRWIMSLDVGVGALALNSIANIFDPRFTEELPEISLDEARERALKAARRLRSLIARASSRLPPDKREHSLRLAYTLLYALYEPLCYLEGLPPSLADTRVPTHTVFDHLYATASMVNLVWYPPPGRPLSGFIVLVDFPGVHEFVDAARRAGDYWAGSWLVSNVMWRLAEKLFDQFGPDVLLSPTPRMNPYFYFGYLCRMLRDLLGERAKDLIEEVEDLAEAFLAKVVGVRVEPERWLLQPLIPGMLLLALPKGIMWADSAKSVANKISELFAESWEEVVSEALDDLRRASERLSVTGQYSGLDLVKCAVYRLLSRTDVLKTPPTGVRVKVIDVGELYSALLECLRGSLEACEKLDLKVSVEKLAEILPPKERALEDLAKVLTFHLAVTSYVERRPSFEFRPVPKPFWSIDGGRLFTSYELAPDVHRWAPCSQCGLEPAVIVLRKSRPAEIKARKPIIQFNVRDLKELLARLGLPVPAESQLERLFRPHFRPGEALGPYCLLKRAVYLGLLARLRKHAMFLSTDDVAMELYVSALEKLLGEGLIKELSRAMAERLGTDPEKCELALELLLQKPRDLESAVYMLLQAQVRVELERFLKCLANSALCVLKKRYGRQAFYVRAIEAFITEPNRGAEGLEEFLKDSLNIVPPAVVEDALRALLRPRDKYVIVCADADDISKLHSGRIGINCLKYVKLLCKLLKERGRPPSRKVLDRLMRSYIRVCDVLRLLGIEEGVAVSPTFKAVISVSLMLAALKDIATVTQSLMGMVIYAGGDDLVALTPVDTIACSLLLRGNYEGEEHFHRLGGAPIAPAIPLGRSMSVRVVSLFDLMSEEISKAYTALELNAKGAVWRSAGREWAKDSLTLSSSRSGIAATLPLRIFEPSDTQSMHAELRAMLARIYASLAIRFLSGSLPEDFDRVYSAAVEVLGPSSLRKVIEYVVSRNVRAPSEERLEYGRRALGADSSRLAYDALFGVFRRMEGSTMLTRRTGSGQIPLVLELLNVVRVLRGLP